MSKNIFICHRPYHILRSCDIIYKQGSSNDENILVSYDVKILKKDEYQRFESNEIFYSMFDNVINLPRYTIPSHKKPFEYIRFFRRLKKKYEVLIEGFADVDKVYFFSDTESEIELLVDLLKDNCKKNICCVLVDEGLVTYNKKIMTTQQSLKSITLILPYLYFLSKMAGFHRFNITGAYGKSLLYDLSLANKPEKSVFRESIKQMLPLSDDLCETLRRKIPNIRTLGESPYSIYVSSYSFPIDVEIQMLKNIKKMLESNGYDFFVKLHPHQEESEYVRAFGKGMIIPKSYPIELFFSPKCVVVGSLSSSLYNAVLQGYYALEITVLFGCDAAISVSDIAPWIKVEKIGNMDEFKNRMIDIRRML